MTITEFENMTITENGGHINPSLYADIECEYMAPENTETKQEFCDRIFGGKVNTSQEITKSWIRYRKSVNSREMINQLRTINAHTVEHIKKLSQTA